MMLLVLPMLLADSPLPSREIQKPTYLCPYDMSHRIARLPEVWDKAISWACIIRLNTRYCNNTDKEYVFNEALSDMEFKSSINEDDRKHINKLLRVPKKVIHCGKVTRMVTYRIIWRQELDGNWILIWYSELQD